MIRVAINGYGRIGRSILRALYESGKRQQIQIVAINELAKPEAICHLTQYDTTHGRFKHTVKLKDDQLLIGDDSILLLNQADAKLLPWAELDIDIVYEATGSLIDRQACEAHIYAGAKQVLISHPLQMLMPLLCMALIMICYAQSIVLFLTLLAPLIVLFQSSMFSISILKSKVVLLLQFTRR